MIDTVQLLQTIDLQELISRDAEQAGRRSYCPFCQGGTRGTNNSPALAVGADHWHCFGCAAGGDAIDYIMLRDQVGFIEACTRLGWNNTGAMDKSAMQAMTEARAQAGAERAAARAAELDRLLAEYTTEEIWAAYHRRLSAVNRAWWASRGINDDWQDYLDLGHTPDKTYRGHDGQLYHSEAYTIPYFHNTPDGKKFTSLQYRLSNPARPQDRYRFENGLRATWYQVVPTEPIQERVIICEGAIKAMVTRIYNEMDGVTFLAIPSKDTFGGIVDAVKDCERVYIALDPDCWKKPNGAPPDWKPAPVKLAHAIGSQARVIELPEKIDDLILKCAPGEKWLERTMRQAVKM